MESIIDCGLHKHNIMLINTQHHKIVNGYR